MFGLFRSWHNERSLNPDGPWGRLTLAIVYATEAHLFITDLNQSPFNVGTRLTLEDFTFEQVAELNGRLALIDEDFRRATEHERRLRHDVIAHIHALGDAAPTARPIIHLGRKQVLALQLL